MSSLEALGWNGFFSEQITTEFAGLEMARVVEEQRGLYRVAGAFDGWAEVSGHLRHEARAAADFPAVGDWVAIVAEPGAPRAIIRRRLERRSAVSRKMAGRAIDEQVLAANVDTIFVVTALTGDLNPRRIERYLTMVWEAGAVPVVVLNKADLCADVSAAADATRARLPFVDVLTISARHAHGLDALGPYLQRATTVALLGSSGVGKSTLLNRLLGCDLQRVRTVSDADGRGRHTTTARQLVELAGGALLIDTPGMRELQPWADESAIDGVFEDIVALARGCRFSDCGHSGEPGCAVFEAVTAGRVDAGRLEHYRRLLRETAFEARKRDKAAAAEEKRRWKHINQSMKALYRQRDR